MDEMFLTIWESQAFWLIFMATGGVFFLIGGIRSLITLAKNFDAESNIFNLAESCNSMALGCAAVAFAALVQGWWFLTAGGACLAVFFRKRERALRRVLRSENALRRLQEFLDKENPNKPDSQEDEDNDHTDH